VLLLVVVVVVLQQAQVLPSAPAVEIRTTTFQNIIRALLSRNTATAQEWPGRAKTLTPTPRTSQSLKKLKRRAKRKTWRN
jgi:hypothetical protein